MSIKETIVNLLNKVYRQDEFVNAVAEAIANVSQSLIDICITIKNDFFFDTLGINGVEWWEKILNITATSTDIEDRRAKIQAKWLSNNHNSVSLIQSICDAWANGAAAVDFVDGEISIEFLSTYGIPSDLDSLMEAIDDVKPAHLSIVWIYKHFLKRDIHQKMTKAQMQTYTKNQYCDVGVGE